VVFDFLDVMDKVTKGQRMDEKEYDNLVFKKSMEMVKEYGFKCDPANPVPSDDQLADEIYEAGLRLAVDVGGWCLNTRRLIKITESEIKESLREAQKEYLAGEGRDAKKIFARRPESTDRVFFLGGTYAPFTEEVAPTIAKAMAMLPIDGISPFNHREISGRRIADMPLEVWANRREIEWTREGITKAGKPGLHVVNYPISTKAAVITSVLQPNYIRKTDGVMTSPLPELFKIDYDCLTANIVAREYGCLVESDVAAMAGGYSGGYEGSTIVTLAGVLLTHAILSPVTISADAGMHCLNPELWATPETQWSHNLCVQAIARNTLIKTRPSVATSAEPCTLQGLMEIAYCTIGVVVSGGCEVFTSRPVVPRRVNLPTPLEAKWGLEISRGALGMSREEADDFIKKIEVPRQKLEVQLKGKSFVECYDLNTLTPNKEYLDIYDTAKKQLTDLGFNFKF